MNSSPPPITILYLDQFVISNLAHVRAGNRKPDDEFWMDVNDRLTRLLTIGQLTCPVSLNHQLESSVSRSSALFKSTAAALSGGWSFDSFLTLRTHQLVASFYAEMAGAPLQTWRSQAPEVLLHEPCHFWRFLEWGTDSLRSIRKQSAGEVEETFRNVFKIHPERTLQQWYDAELAVRLKGYAPLVVNNVPENLRDAALQFMERPTAKAVPFLNTSSWMCAVLARKAAQQEKSPSPGFLADLDASACLSPYCDAMFVDREFCAYWSELHLAGRIDLPTLIFSLADKAGFLTFLDKLIVNTSVANR